MQGTHELLVNLPIPTTVAIKECPSIQSLHAPLAAIVKVETAPNGDNIKRRENLCLRTNISRAPTNKIVVNLTKSIDLLNDPHIHNQNHQGIQYYVQSFSS